MPPPLQVDLLILKVVFESRVTWATSVPILVFLGLSVLDLGRPDERNSQTDVRRASSLNAPYPRGGSIIRRKTCRRNCRDRSHYGAIR